MVVRHVGARERRFRDDSGDRHRHHRAPRCRGRGRAIAGRGSRGESPTTDRFGGYSKHKRQRASTAIHSIRCQAVHAANAGGVRGAPSRIFNGSPPPATAEFRRCERFAGSSAWILAPVAFRFSLPWCQPIPTTSSRSAVLRYMIHVAARLVHVTPTEYEGQPMYMVGCAYTGRLDY